MANGIYKKTSAKNFSAEDIKEMKVDFIYNPTKSLFPY
jgi:hypothetical protein